MNTIIKNLVDEIEISVDGLNSNTLLHDDHLKVVLYGFAAGQELSKHTAPVPVMIQILDGKADLTVGDEKLVASTNTFTHVAAKVPHSIAAITDTKMLLIMLKGAK